MTDSNNLPVPSAGHAEPDTHGVARLAPSSLQGAIGDLQQVWNAVTALDASGSTADVSTILHAGVECVGSTVAEALQVALAFVLRSPHVEVTSLPYARVPGPVEGTWEYRVTVLVSYPDANGEIGGATHVADRRR
ncbi:hypothetical protein [Streptacidiphilus sp. EB129]|uniref:hypothetical protein n=1 Tax=Streptacidiphilus sp. EB129 TaxID=3156262 RepID=UPI003512BBDF